MATSGRGLITCGIDGCPHTEQYPHLMGQHRRYAHLIEGQSPTALRNRRRQAQTNSAPAKPVRVVAPKPADLPPEWGAWTPQEAQHLRLLAAAWGLDLPATVDLLRSRTFATVARMPAVQRLARQERVIAESRRQVMRAI